jgi:hypothetical protein
VHRPITRLCAALIVAALGARAGEAAAQDFGVGPQREPTLTTSRLGLETSWASFNLPNNQGDFNRGEYFGLTVRGDVKLARNVGLRVLVPMYLLQLDGQSASNGFGDAALRARFLLLDANPWRFYAGLEQQLPTGNTAIGTGQGGVQLSPFITGGWRKGSVVVYASVADSIGLHPRWGTGRLEPVDYVDPSSDHELRSNFGVIGEIAEPLYVNGALTAITLLEPGDAGKTLLIGGAALGYVVSEDFKLVLVGQLPVAGEHRFEQRIGLNAYLYF